MNKVRRGDFPADLPESGMPANIRGGKVMYPLSNKGPTKDNTGAKSSPRRDLTGSDACGNVPRRELTAADSMRTPKTDE